MMWDGYDAYGGWVWMGVMFALILVVAAAVTVVLVMLRPGRHGPTVIAGDPRAAEADRILARRFAAGEIDEDEYKRRRETLRR